MIELLAELASKAVAQINTTRCGNISDTYVQELCSGNLIDAGVNPFWDSMGPLFPVMVALIYLPGAYVASGDLAIPLTTIVFLGAIISQYLPAPFSFLGVMVVAIGIGIAIFLGIHRLRRES